MRLVAGRVGQEFNQRKNRKGAFREGYFLKKEQILSDHLK